MPKNLFKIIATAVIVKNNKFLIAKRSEKEERFPGLWTVPGGKMDTGDYTKGKKDTAHYWYNALETTLKREITEEVGMKIKNIRYVTSLADNPKGKDPSIVLSLMADWTSGKGKISNEIIEFSWVDLKEAKKYKLIEGIYEELEQADKLLKGERTVWKKKK